MSTLPVTIENIDSEVDSDSAESGDRTTNESSENPTDSEELCSSQDEETVENVQEAARDPSPELPDIEQFSERLDALRRRDSTSSHPNQSRRKRVRRSVAISASESEDEPPRRTKKITVSKMIEFGAFGEYEKADEYREFLDWVAIVRASIGQSHGGDRKSVV